MYIYRIYYIIVVFTIISGASKITPNWINALRCLYRAKELKCLKSIGVTKEYRSYVVELKSQQRQTVNCLKIILIRRLYCI